MEDLYHPAVLGPDVHSVGLKVIEICTRRGALCGWVPPVVFGGDVAFVIDAMPVAVVDGELVIFKAVVLYQSADDKAVVHAVTVGGDDIGV